MLMIGVISHIRSKCTSKDSGIMHFTPASPVVQNWYIQQSLNAFQVWVVGGEVMPPQHYIRSVMELRSRSTILIMQRKTGT